MVTVVKFKEWSGRRRLLGRRGRRGGSDGSGSTGKAAGGDSDYPLKKGLRLVVQTAAEGRGVKTDFDTDPGAGGSEPARTKGGFIARATCYRSCSWASRRTSTLVPKAVTRAIVLLPDPATTSARARTFT